MKDPGQPAATNLDVTKTAVTACMHYTNLRDIIPDPLPCHVALTAGRAAPSRPPPPTFVPSSHAQAPRLAQRRSKVLGSGYVGTYPESCVLAYIADLPRRPI